MSKDPTLAAVAALTLEPSQEVPSGSGVSFAQVFGYFLYFLFHEYFIYFLKEIDITSS